MPTVCYGVRYDHECKGVVVACIENSTVLAFHEGSAEHADNSHAGHYDDTLANFRTPNLQNMQLNMT
jgi:hypothetical protein